MIRYIIVVLFLLFLKCDAGLMSTKCEKKFSGYGYRYYTNVYSSGYSYTYRYYAKRYYYPFYQFECIDIPSEIEKIELNVYVSYSNPSSGPPIDVAILKKCGTITAYSYGEPTMLCSGDLLTDIGWGYGTTRSKKMFSSAMNSPKVGTMAKGAGWKKVTIDQLGNFANDLSGDFTIGFSMREPKSTYTYHYAYTGGNSAPYLNVYYEQAASCYGETHARSNYKYSEDIYPGNTATIECAAGYELIDPLDNTATCSGDDTFDKPNLCKLLTCPMPATPFNSESVDVYDELEEPTDRFHHLGYYKYKCKEGYRATVTNPTDSKDSRTGVIQCIGGKFYQNGTNPEVSPRRYAWAKDGTVTPYCASIAKTNALVVPIAMQRMLFFNTNKYYQTANYFSYYKMHRDTTSGIYAVDVAELRRYKTAMYGTKKTNTRFQWIWTSDRSYKPGEMSLFLLKDYSYSRSGEADQPCYRSRKDKCVLNTSPPTDDTNPNGIRKTLRKLTTDNDGWKRKLCFKSSSCDARTARSFINSQIDAPFPSTINVTYSGLSESVMDRGSVAENPVDSVAIEDCIGDDTCATLWFGDYWRDHYIDIAGISTTSSYLGWDGTYNKYAYGEHNPMAGLRNKHGYYYSYFFADGYYGDGMEYSSDNVNTPSAEVDGHTVTSLSGMGKDAALIMYIDELCHNAWTIDVAGADSSWCRENLLVGGTCVPDCAAGTKSNKQITCTDPKTFSVTVPEGITCVIDTCPGSPQTGSIPSGKVNDCIALNANETCNPLCNEGMEATGQISCPNGITNNTFQCAPPCGTIVPVNFNHGGDNANGANRMVNLFGDILPQSTFAVDNTNPCLFIKPGETCKPTCNTGYALEGEMTCSAETVFSSTAVCRSSCYIDRLVPNATNKDCQTKLLNPGEHCIVRTKGGYSFPDNTNMANITCDANGDIIYPPDPKKDCDWDPVPFGDVRHCLPNVKDTILNVQGACKPGQIVKDAETCVHMYKMIDKHDLKSNWSFARGKNKQLDDKGNYNLDTEADDPDYQYRYYTDTSPLGCGLGHETSSKSQSHGYFGRVYRDITKVGTAGKYPSQTYYNIGVSKNTQHTFVTLIQATYDMLRGDIENQFDITDHPDFTLPGGFYETNDPWEQYEFIKTFMHWYLSSDDVPAGHYLHTGGNSRQAIIKPSWAQDDCDMIRAREYGYPLFGSYFSSYYRGPYYYLYYYAMIRYGLGGPRYYYDRSGHEGASSNGKCHGIGNTGRNKYGSVNLVNILGQGGGHWNYNNYDRTYMYPSICNPPMQKNWGETCTPICKKGYELEGAAQTCSADGTMSAAPKCVREFCATQPNSNWKDLFEHGDVSHCDSVARKFTDAEPIGCVPVCDTGYKIQGSIGCESKYENLVNDLKCELKCPGLVDALANFDDDGASVSHCVDMNHGEKCEATCDTVNRPDDISLGDIYCLPRFGCSDTCASANDGTCDDGGNGATYATCDLGTDCTDCGARTPNNVENNARCEKEFTLSQSDIQLAGVYPPPGYPKCTNIKISLWDTYGDGWFYNDYINPSKINFTDAVTGNPIMGTCVSGACNTTAGLIPLLNLYKTKPKAEYASTDWYSTLDKTPDIYSIDNSDGSIGDISWSWNTTGGWNNEAHVRFHCGNAQSVHTMNNDNSYHPLYTGKVHTFADQTAGVTWSYGTPAVSSYYSYWYGGITMSDDGTKLAAGVYGGNIWTSSDSGATWTEVTSVGATKYWYGITSSADGTKLAAVVVGGNIWTSSDSGATWTEVTSTGATKWWYGITSSANGTKLAAVVRNGNIWTSSDSGATWTEDTSVGATKYWRKITSSADGTKLAAVVYNGNIWTSSNSGATWTSVAATSTWYRITMSDDGTKLAAGEIDGYIYTSSDSGATWTLATGSINGMRRSWYGIASSADGTKLAAMSYYGYLWSSDDSGATWIQDTSTAKAYWYDMTMSPDGNYVAAVRTYGDKIYRRGIDLTALSWFSPSALPAGCDGSKITLSSSCSPNCRGFFNKLNTPFHVTEDENGNETLVNAICSGPCVVTTALLGDYGSDGTCSVGQMNPNTTCVPGCKSGYVISGDISCTTESELVSSVTCTPGLCSTQPSMPEKASWDSYDLYVDTSIEIPCRLGFSSVGMYSCKDNVLSGNPKCVRQCVRFPKNDGEEVFITDKGSQSAMKCASGYTSEGIFDC